VKAGKRLPGASHVTRTDHALTIDMDRIHEAANEHGLGFLSQEEIAMRLAAIPLEQPLCINKEGNRLRK
jgi:hypothetical protein